MNTQPQPKIASIAYLMWEEAGRPAGRDLEFWLQAERQLAARSPTATRTASLENEFASAERSSRPRKSAEAVKSVR